MGPISTTYLNLQTARASAVLPAAGAYDAAPLELFCPGFNWSTLFVEYTRGGAGGAVTLKIEVSPVSSGDHWFSVSHYGEGVNAVNSNTLSTVQMENIKYGAVGATIEKFVISVELRMAAERIRVSCCESGAVGTPGTTKITATFGTGS